jgi:hypothetical protein
LVIAAVAAMGSVWLATYQYQHTRRAEIGLGRPYDSMASTTWRPRASHILKTESGRQMLWAYGPRDLEKGAWFDVTDSPLDPTGYQHGIGKDTIPAIDEPKFVAIDDLERLHAHGMDDDTSVLGYLHNGEAKAYPIQIMNQHELVNDVVGGKPVTVGW